MQFKLTFVALALSAITSVAATAVNPREAHTGINCNGSLQCSQAVVPTLGQLLNLVNGGVDNNRNYGDGQQIACLSHLCAFFQKTGTSNSGASVKTLLQGLADHHCSKCGSNPSKPGNNVDTGELTVNYVSSPACEGIC